MKFCVSCLESFLTTHMLQSCYIWIIHCFIFNSGLVSVYETLVLLILAYFHGLIKLAFLTCKSWKCLTLIIDTQRDTFLFKPQINRDQKMVSSMWHISCITWKVLSSMHFMLLAVKSIFTECGFSQWFIVDIHSGVFRVSMLCGCKFKDGGSVCY